MDNVIDAPKAFTVKPMAQTLSLTAGESTSGSITIINPLSSESDFSYKVTVVPYGVKEDGEEADLLTESPQTELVKWITIEKPTGKVPVGESTQVDFTINVPESAPGGGQYAAIIVSSNDTSDTTSTVDYVYEIASILYTEVDGQIVRNGSIVDHQVPGFSTTPKVSVTSQLENKGNIHEFAKVSLTVTNFLSGEEIYSTEEAEVPTTEIVMPGSTRTIIRDISNLPSLGIVTIKESIDYLGQNSTIERQLAICPLWFILLAAFTVVAIVAAFVARFRRRKPRGKKKNEADEEA